MRSVRGESYATANAWRDRVFRLRGCRRRPLIAAITAAVVLFVPVIGADANPAGGQVVAGQASIASKGSTLAVTQTSNRAIINWQSFSIAHGETTKFYQPSAAAAVLNRVISNNPSAIYGTLSANGQVYLINANGILIGPGGVVNTQSFVASIADIPNAQFMQGGALTFTGTSSAGVVNQGSITANGGSAVLIGNTVSNDGSITAQNGVVALAAGGTVLLTEDGWDHVFIKAGGAGGQTGIDQEGSIQAAAAELKAAGGNVYALAINNGGAINATAVEDKGGRILLEAPGGNVQSSGTLQASDGGAGGLVNLVGGDIALTGNALVDVSGDQGGGTVNIGGSTNEDPGYQAKTATIASGAKILADANKNGNGGTVNVWSTDYTRDAGLISAHGGQRSGNGGTIDVSSDGTVDITGSKFDVSAPNGQPGQVTIDPTVLIDSFTGDSSLNGSLWTVNGTVATDALTNFDSSPTATIVTPTITFTAQGIGIGTSASTYIQGGVQSVSSFTPPFTLTATGLATSINAGVLQLAISTANGGAGISIDGGQGGSSATTGFPYTSPSGAGTHWNLLGNLSSSAPTLNQAYTLTISVNASGTATASVSSGGTQLGSATSSVGTGPFYVILAQGSGAYSSGNPSQAYWSSIQITTPSSTGGGSGSGSSSTTTSVNQTTTSQFLASASDQANTTLGQVGGYLESFTAGEVQLLNSGKDLTAVSPTLGALDSVFGMLGVGLIAYNDVIAAQQSMNDLSQGQYSQANYITTQALSTTMIGIGLGTCAESFGAGCFVAAGGMALMIDPNLPSQISTALSGATNAATAIYQPIYGNVISAITNVTSTIASITPTTALTGIQGSGGQFLQDIGDFHL